MACSSRDELTACLQGRLTDSHAGRIFAHLTECAACHDALHDLDHSTDFVMDALRAAAPPFEVTSACQSMLARASMDPGVSSLSSAKDPLWIAGEMIRDYLLIERLGQGGMGTVFRALHTRLKREVALKVISPRRFGSPRAVERFQEEMAAIGGLNHPQVVKALDAGEEQGTHYLVMELISGMDAARLHRLIGSFPWEAAVTLVAETAQGLKAIHAKGLVHRDIKPSNLMVDRQGRVRILDLGLAILRKDSDDLSGSGEAGVGSLNFMAPEQAVGGQCVDRAADIYSLGKTFQALRGTRGDHPATAPEPAAVSQLIARMVSEHPAARPTADEVARVMGSWGKSGLAAIIRQGMALDPGTSTLSSGPSTVSSAGSHGTRRRRATAWRLFLGVPIMALIVGIQLWRRTAPSPNPPSTNPTPNVRVPAPSAMEGPLITYELEALESGRAVRLRWIPGQEVLVSLRSVEGAVSPEEFRVWDLMELKWKQPAAYMVWETYAPVLRDPMAWFPHQAADIGKEVRILRHSWTSAEGSRMFIVRDCDKSLRLSLGRQGEARLEVSRAADPVLESYSSSSTQGLREEHPEIIPLLDECLAPAIAPGPLVPTSGIP